ncbi:MAG: hypothetical protein M5U34_25585 [Chloroflexi bacterium]|nr:hypothetical protein [Chloroflexota bacterium]
MAAYLARYEWQLFLAVPEQFYEPYSRYLSQQLILVGLLILTFPKIKCGTDSAASFGLTRCRGWHLPPPPPSC